MGDRSMWWGVGGRLRGGGGVDEKVVLIEKVDSVLKEQIGCGQEGK